MPDFEAIIESYNDIQEIIESYNDIRRQCYDLARRNNGELMGDDSWLCYALNESDITLSLTDEGIYCYGMAYTMQTGGSNEPFELTIPLNLIGE